MASIRRLKKDIDYLTFAVIADCFNYNCYNPSNAEVIEIVKDMVATRNSLRARVSNADVEAKELKGYYKGIFNEVLTKADTSFTKLSEIIKEGK